MFVVLLPVQSCMYRGSVRTFMSYFLLCFASCSGLLLIRSVAMPYLGCPCAAFDHVTHGFCESKETMHYGFLYFLKRARLHVSHRQSISIHTGNGPTSFLRASLKVQIVVYESWSGLMCTVVCVGVARYSTLSCFIGCVIVVCAWRISWEHQPPLLRLTRCNRTRPNSHMLGVSCRLPF